MLGNQINAEAVRNQATNKAACKKLIFAGIDKLHKFKEITILKHTLQA